MTVSWMLRRLQRFDEFGLGLFLFNAALLLLGRALVLCLLCNYGMVSCHRTF